MSLTWHLVCTTALRGLVRRPFLCFRDAKIELFSKLLLLSWPTNPSIRAGLQRFIPMSDFFSEIGVDVISRWHPAAPGASEHTAAPTPMASSSPTLPGATQTPSSDGTSAPALTAAPTLSPTRPGETRPPTPRPPATGAHLESFRVGKRRSTSCGVM